MVVCSRCNSSDTTSTDDGSVVCVNCGLVLDDQCIVSELGFQEGSNGVSSTVGQYVSGTSKSFRRLGGLNRDNREVSIENGRRRINMVASALKLKPHHAEAAQRLYNLAIQHNFIQGRRTQNVVAACLYIVCRREKTPHMLIDFSDVLHTNVYVLGHTFLKMCQLLNLQLPIIDPSLYIQRFAAQLEFDEKTNAVANTALRLVQRMKRDWIQTGRRPSGICGASLLIAARIHGFRRTQKEIVQVVRICDVTLRKRLSEFSSTPTCNLTQEEFETMDLEEECDPPAFIKGKIKEENQKLKKIENETDVLLELERGERGEYDEEPKKKERPKKKKSKEKDKDEKEIEKDEEGEKDGKKKGKKKTKEKGKKNKSKTKKGEKKNSENETDTENKPKTKKNKKGKGKAKEKEKEKEKEKKTGKNQADKKLIEDNDESNVELTDDEDDEGIEILQEMRSILQNPDVIKIKETAKVDEINNGRFEPILIDSSSNNSIVITGSRSIPTSTTTSKSNSEETTQNALNLGVNVPLDSPDDLTDIKDSEIDVYIIQNEDEVKLKTEIWMDLNKEYLEKMAQKEKEEEELKASGVNVPAKTRKRKRDVNKKELADTAAEATAEVLKKKLSHKINLAALEGLFVVDNAALENISPLANNAFLVNNGNGDSEIDTLNDSIVSNDY